MYTYTRRHTSIPGLIYVHHARGCRVFRPGLIHRIAAVLMRSFGGPTDNWGEWAVRARRTRYVSYVQLLPGRGPWGCRSRYARRGPGHRAYFHWPRPRPAQAGKALVLSGLLIRAHARYMPVVRAIQTCFRVCEMRICPSTIIVRQEQLSNSIICESK